MVNSYIDILLILIIAYNVLRGWQSGFVISLVDLASWIASLLFAFRFYEEVGRWLDSLLDLSPLLTRPVGFAVAAILAGLVLTVVGRAVVDRIPRRLHKNAFNRLFGLLPGLVSGLIATAIISSFLLSLPLAGTVLEATRDSALASRFASRTEALESELAPIFGDAISHTLNLLTIHPESDEVVRLPYTATDAVPAPELERQMLELINQERARSGLPPLQMDPELTQVARQHSQDMFARGYFSHLTPEGLSPFERIQNAGVSYLVAGENLAHAPTLSIAHTGLMNSPGHRANILHPAFGQWELAFWMAGHED